MAPERPTPLHDVARHRRHRETKRFGDRLLGDDRRLQARPDLRAPGPHVGDRAVRFERTVARECERERAVDRLRQQRQRGRAERQLGRLQLGDHVGVGLRAGAARRPRDLERSDRVDALTERCRAHRHATRDDHDVGDAGHRIDRGDVRDRHHIAVDGRRPAHHRRQRAGHVEIHCELFAARDDVAGFDALLRCADDREVRRGLQLDGHGGGVLRCRASCQRPVGDSPAVRRREDAIAGGERRHLGAELARGCLRELLAREGGRDAHRSEDRVHRVGAAGELVPDQLGPGVGESD